MSNPTHTLKTSFVKRMLKHIIKRTESILPTAIFKPLYSCGFTAYRILIRIFYIKTIAVASFKGNNQELKKSQLIFKVMPYSLVGSQGLAATYDAVQLVNNNKLKGSLVECGVAQGGSAALMAIASVQGKISRDIWLFDSFEGLPPPTSEDYDNDSYSTGTHIRPLDEGSCLGTYEEVEHLLLRKFKLPKNTIHMEKGWFENTIPLKANSTSPIAILRIDADWYESVRTCLQYLYDEIAPGGIVIIDDYDTCIGAKKAVDQFLYEGEIKVSFKHDGRGGIYFSKPEE